MDKETFDKARLGDKHSIELIVDKFYRLACSTAYDWVRKGVISVDDAIGEAHVALMHCIRGSFDADKGTFVPYLVKSVDNQIRMFLRKERRDAAFLYTDIVVQTDDGDMNILDLLEDETVCVCDEALDNVYSKWLMPLVASDLLTEKERDCLMLRMHGMPCEEVGQCLGISRSYASRLSNDACKKLRSVVKKVGL